MTTNKKVDVHSAIDILKSGGNIDKIIISDLTTSKVQAMDALMLAENGFLVPDGNIVYDDDEIQYDADFDEVTWGKPVPFKTVKESLSSESAKHLSETAELIVKLQIRSSDMKQWLAQNQDQLNFVIGGLLESMYQAERLPKT